MSKRTFIMIGLLFLFANMTLVAAWPPEPLLIAQYKITDFDEQVTNGAGWDLIGDEDDLEHDDNDEIYSILNTPEMSTNHANIYFEPLTSTWPSIDEIRIVVKMTSNDPDCYWKVWIDGTYYGPYDISQTYLELTNLGGINIEEFRTLFHTEDDSGTEKMEIDYWTAMNWEW